MTSRRKQEEVLKALQLLSAAGVLIGGEDALAAVTEAYKPRDPFTEGTQTVLAVVIVQGLAHRGRETAQEQWHEAGMVRAVLRWLTSLGWCTAKAETLQTVHDRIAAGRAGGMKIIVSLPSDKRSG